MGPRSLVRLNFQITKTAQDRLEKYSCRSGRNASDVVRQLVMEYLDGERPLRMHLSSLNGRRSNCMLPNTVVEKLSERVEESDCYSTRGGVISLLLQDFLAQQDDGAGAFKVLNKLLQACEEKDRGGDVFSYHEALLEARKLLRQGE